MTCKQTPDHASFFIPRRTRSFTIVPSLRFIRTFAFLLIAGFILCAAPSYAQDIDEVMEGLESDFKFGGKEDVKRQNITNANESLREDISIANTSNSNSPTLVDVLFSIHEYIGDGDSITVDIANVSTLATGVDGMTVTGSAQLQPDSTHLLRVSCVGSFNCEFYVFIIKGALFIPSNLEDTGSGSGIFMNAGNTITLQFKVNKDNSAQAKPVPSPPPQTPM